MEYNLHLVSRTGIGDYYWLWHERGINLKLDIQRGSVVIDDVDESRVLPALLCAEYHRAGGPFPSEAAARLKVVGYRVLAVERWNVTLVGR